MLQVLPLNRLIGLLLAGPLVFLSSKQLNVLPWLASGISTWCFGLILESLVWLDLAAVVSEESGQGNLLPIKEVHSPIKI